MLAGFFSRLTLQRVMEVESGSERFRVRKTSFQENVLGPVVQRPISAKAGLNFNLGFFFFCLKAFSPENFLSLF